MAPREVAFFDWIITPSTKKSIQPLPCAFLAHPEEMVLVFLVPLLKIGVQVEERLRQGVALAEQERDEEPAEPAVAVVEGMDGFELIAGSRPAR